MMRCVILTVTVLFLCAGPIGCSDEVEETRNELGVKPGRRPVPEVQIKPPGPPNPTLVAEQPAPESEDADDEDTDTDPD